jgi:single-strand DNA-binding protein
MAKANKVFLIGNLTRDSELRYTPAGTAICTFDIAVNDERKTTSGEIVKDVLFMTVNTFGKRAEACAQYLKKGSLAYIEGKLRLETWEDKDTGKKRSKITTTARDVQFLHTKRELADD